MAGPVTFDCLNPFQASYTAEAVMIEKANRSNGMAFLLAILAGALIGLGFIYCGVVNIAGGGNILGGLVFSMGLTFVILLGGDLFTSSTLTLITGASKQVAWSRIFINWGVVYVGNFVGSIFVSGLVFFSGHLWASGGKAGLWYLSTGAYKLSHTPVEAFTLGMLCNIMVCIAVWVSFSGRSTLDKMFCCLFPVGLFILGGFEHSVANMFMIPSGIFIMHFAPQSFLQHVPNIEHMRELFTWSNFLILNLIPVTIGNFLGGGVLIGLFNWWVYLRPGVKRQ